MRNISKKLIGVIVLVIALIAGGLFWQASVKEKQAQMEQKQVEVKQKNENNVIQPTSTPNVIPTDIDMDVNHWQTYHSKQNEYEFKYPKTWTMTEFDTELPVDSIYSRYVLLQPEDKSFNIEIGIKNINEKNVMNASWRTGTSAEDIQASEKFVSVGNTRVQEVNFSYYETYDDYLSKNKDKMHLQEIYFCTSNDTPPCNNTENRNNVGFKIKNDTFVFARIAINSFTYDANFDRTRFSNIESQWNNMEKTTSAILSSIYIFNSNK